MNPTPGEGRAALPATGEREVLAALGGLALRAGLRLRDLTLLAPRSSRLLRLELGLLARGLRHSPYRGPDFDEALALARAGGRLDDLTYGEVPWWTLRALLRWAGLRRGELFADLGCGTGRALALAAQLFGARGLGVELVAGRLQLARAALPAARWPEIALMGADLTTVELAGVDVALLNWTCFDTASRARTARHLESLAPGARVLALTHPLPGAGWQRAPARTVWLSWGRGTAHLHVRC